MVPKSSRQQQVNPVSFICWPRKNDVMTFEKRLHVGSCLSSSAALYAVSTVKNYIAWIMQACLQEILQVSLSKESHSAL